MSYNDPTSLETIQKYANQVKNLQQVVASKVAAVAVFHEIDMTTWDEILEGTKSLLQEHTLLAIESGSIVLPQTHAMLTHLRVKIEVLEVFISQIGFHQTELTRNHPPEI